MNKSSRRSRRHRAILSKEKESQKPFFSVKNADMVQNKPGNHFFFQAKTDADAVEASAAQEKYWTGSIKGHLGENPVKYHTLNNFSDTPLRYLLRIKNQGYCLLSLETQYEYKTTGLQRAWIALFEQRKKTGEVINGLPPHSSLHLRLFGERDYTNQNRTWCEGTVETVLQK